MQEKHWMIIVAFLLTCTIIMRNYYIDTDISLFQIKSTNKSYSDQKIWLISYGDKGIHIQNQNNLLVSASIYQIFDIIMPYQLHNIEPEYYEKHKEILSKKRGAGYWLWKPYFILKTLKMMRENDILLYADTSGVFRSGIYKFLELAKINDVTIFSNIHSNRRMIKKSVVEKMVNGDDSYLDKTQLDTSMILLRNTAKSREIIEEWLKYCEDSELLTDIPSKTEYLDFKDHRHDQSILSIMYHKNPEKFYLYDYHAKIGIFELIRRRENKESMLPITFNNIYAIWCIFKMKVINKIINRI